MNQYNSKIPALLQSKDAVASKFKIVNGMVEFELDGERVLVPTAEAFMRLLKKITVLEQKLAAVDNKASRNTRSKG